MASTSQDPEEPRRFIEHHVAALREFQNISNSSQAHHDRMLTWSIGLMGAGVFSAYGHLSAHSRGAVLAPWALGILLAILARLVSLVVQDRDRALQFKKTNELLGLLVPADAPALIKSA